jgi:hypothetical protein
VSEPLLERLSRFTPDAGNLNRDALLFAAGRSSARPNRGWKSLALTLAGTQALTLVFLRPAPTQPAGRLTIAGANPRAPAAAREPEPIVTSPTAGVWTVRTGLLEAQTRARPADNVTFIDREPQLRAFPRRPPMLPN